MSAVVSPRLFTSLATHFFTKTCSIQAYTASRDTYGAETFTWADRTGYTSIPCAVGQTQRERKLQTMTQSIGSLAIVLGGTYTGITVGNRAVVSSVNYDILAVEHDVLQSLTVLRVQVAT